MASELKIASAFFLVRRCSLSSSLASGCPMNVRRMRSAARPTLVVGADAAWRAVSTFGAE